MACKWPCTPNYCEAAENLFETIDRALDAFRIDVARKAIACSRHDETFGGALTPAEHLQHTKDALIYANNNQWLSCIEELEHLGGGGEDYTKEQQETPPDWLVEEMEQKLAEWKGESTTKKIFLPGKGWIEYTLVWAELAPEAKLDQARKKRKKKSKAKRKKK